MGSTPTASTISQFYDPRTTSLTSTTAGRRGVVYPMVMLDPEVTPETYVQLRDSATPPTLLDVREPWEAETASIPGATLIPLGEITSRAHTELDPDLPIIVFCHHGQRSLSVTMWLREQGFDQAQSLSGGIDHYSRVIDHSIPRY